MVIISTRETKVRSLPYLNNTTDNILLNNVRKVGELVLYVTVCCPAIFLEGGGGGVALINLSITDLRVEIETWCILGIRHNDTNHSTATSGDN
jgi:hypothetical protein